MMHLNSIELVFGCGLCFGVLSKSTMITFWAPKMFFQHKFAHPHLMSLPLAKNQDGNSQTTNSRIQKVHKTNGWCQDYFVHFLHTVYDCRCESARCEVCFKCQIAAWAESSICRECAMRRELVRRWHVTTFAIFLASSLMTGWTGCFKHFLQSLRENRQRAGACELLRV